MKPTENLDPDTLTKDDYRREQKECRRRMEFAGICFACLLVYGGAVLGFLACHLLQTHGVSLTSLLPFLGN